MFKVVASHVDPAFQDYDPHTIYGNQADNRMHGSEADALRVADKLNADPGYWDEIGGPPRYYVRPAWPEEIEWHLADSA